MPSRLTCITSLLLLAVVASTAHGEKPAAKPRQFVLSVRLFRETKDGAHELSEPNLALTENHTAQLIVGGEMGAGTSGMFVPYGTKIDARAKGKKDGRIQLDFVAEHSTLADPESSDFDGESRVCKRKWTQFAVQAFLSPKHLLVIVVAEAVFDACDDNPIDDVKSLPTEKVVGSVTMKPGVVYRIVSRNSAPRKPGGNSRSRT